MINVSNLNKYYNKSRSNEIHVINDVNLVFPNTGFVVLLGASGSGKTTLINVIAGLDKAKGEISYDEATFKKYKMNKIDSYRRENIGYVFQNYNLLSNMTVYDNLRITLNLIGIRNEDEIKERIHYVLKMLGMLKYKNKLASNLSGGQMQRVSIARALVKDSKIIIADEPTGNLDSENTIEVMNILKAISKTRLVIMVTHDRNNASFYADRIIEIKDGKVENDYENNSKDELENRDKTKIYLKDLKEETLNINGIKINLFLEDGESLDDLNLTIVKKDGNIYLKSDEVSYLSSNSKIRLINDNYKTLKKEDILNFEYNPKPLVKDKKKFSLMPLFRGLANAYSAHRDSSRKMKGLHACFVIIGVVMAVCVLMLSVGTYVKDDKIDYSNHSLVIYKANIDTLDKTLNEAISSGLILDYDSRYSLSISYGQADSVSLDSFVHSVYYELNNNTMIEGSKEVSDNEIVITKRIADNFIKKLANISNLTYKDLIGMTVNDEYIIKGICNGDSTDIYVPHYNYLSNTFSNSSKTYPASFGSNSVSVELPTNIPHKIIRGREVESDNECIVNVDYYFTYLMNNVGTEVNIYGKEFNIVGWFKTEEGVSSTYYLIDDKDTILKSIDFNNNSCNLIGRNRPICADYVELVSGRKPVSPNEILISEWMDLEKNSSMQEVIKENDLVVVGRFKTDFSMDVFRFALTKEALILDKIDSPYAGNNGIIVSDKEAIMDIYKANGFTLKTSYDYYHSRQVKQKTQMFASTITVSFVFLVIIVVYTFFMMRSKMIHRIYEIGVLREIGASRARIYRVFFIELLVLITLTTILGYLVSLGLFFLAGRRITGILGLFNYSPLYAFIGFVILYVVSIVAGMLPIFTLQRKTPAEIVAKYDL